jgi:drug/metabolite transporter (DMT)-like permease
MFDHLWALFTVGAAAAQTARNAMQKEMTARLGTLGATHVRFLYGAPFAVLFFAVVAAAVGRLPPAPDALFLAWVAFGGLAQILATMLMLAAMRERSFVVTVAYTKTEPVQAALIAIVVLGETVTPMMAVAILLATAGVMVMSWPKDGAFSWRPALFGVASGGLFAAAAVGFKGAIVELRELGEPSFVLAATTTLAYGLLLQAAAFSAWLAWRERAVLAGVVGAWRASLLAGFAGAAASQMWFLAFALEQVARVRTLGLVEMLFAWAISRRVMNQPTSAREAAGIALVVVGVALILNAR